MSAGRFRKSQEVFFWFDLLNRDLHTAGSEIFSQLGIRTWLCEAGWLVAFLAPALFLLSQRFASLTIIAFRVASTRSLRNFSKECNDPPRQRVFVGLSILVSA